MMKTVKILTLALTSTLLLSGCSNDDDSPIHIHDNESIHEFVVTRTNEDGTNPVEYTFEAGDVISDDIMKLDANNTYILEVTGMMSHGPNDAEENIIGEIIEEKETHFFEYTKTSNLEISLTRIDDASTTRADGTKIGKKIKITTGAADQGSFLITLKHEPTKVDDQANDGFGSSEGGSSDITATYKVIIE